MSCGTVGEKNVLIVLNVLLAGVDVSCIVGSISKLTLSISTVWCLHLLVYTNYTLKK